MSQERGFPSASSQGETIPPIRKAALWWYFCKPEVTPEPKREKNKKRFCCRNWSSDVFLPEQIRATWSTSPNGNSVGTCVYTKPPRCARVCVNTPVSSLPFPRVGWPCAFSTGRVLQCDITPSSLLCNCTHIKAQHIALRREDIHERQEAIADGSAPAPTSSVNREKLLLLSCVERRTVHPPCPTAGGSEAWHIKGWNPAWIVQCRAVLLRLTTKAMEILAAKIFSTWETLWDSGEIN